MVALSSRVAFLVKCRMMALRVAVGAVDGRKSNWHGEAREFFANCLSSLELSGHMDDIHIITGAYVCSKRVRKGNDKFGKLCSGNSIMNCRKRRSFMLTLCSRLDFI